MLKEKTVAELEKRMADIVTELDDENADLDALENEAKEIKEELEERKNVELKKNEIRSKVANGEGIVERTFVEEEKPAMTNKEIRNSDAYINAYANYIKTNDDKECRVLLSENVDGVVPVPTYLEGFIRTAWERSGLMNLVRKTFIRGNVQIGFELSADGAVIHEEGGKAIDPENLTFGTVMLVPVSIKKLIKISDEALDLAGREFLDYLYDELVYQISKKAEEMIVDLIIKAPTTATEEAVSVTEIDVELGIGTIATALGYLNAEATNPVIVTTRQNWSALKVASYNAQYSVDPFEGLPVYFASASAMQGASLIVGDFGIGVHANFPNGADIDIKFDDRTDMASDLVNILGRQFVGMGLVTDKAFVRVMGSVSE